MAKHLVIAVDWYGPYDSIQSARKAIRADAFGSGLYFAIGRCRARDPLAPQYVGISKDLASRVGNQHGALTQISDLSLWIGEVGTASVSGPKVKATPPTLDFAEWLTAYFMDLPLNTMKRITIPNVSVSLLNRWWKQDYMTARKKRPHPDWPDFIDFLGHYYPTKIVWFGKKMKKVGPIVIE